ncbi:Predicted thiol-disulfide oxidoreductase YuxK, DCC family [Lentibacillus persicus]|uniref:Predicted thiol-disulfide oxidoreductase YuxK, DCC family n=1 Tax=Lentibacillus persicus TaxID=640948 RepID=A0A1I1YG17_9BACI|nr:DUF393 domain-containing protein [Lentibacillus persicus]SFE18252.1 Predicted thiol-disulfide oxidoreductase YuxK, DCC family [Lentibacillus persicus]
MTKHIVFYDAECPLCRTVKAVLMKLDKNDAILWHPVQKVREDHQLEINIYKNMYDEIYMYTKNKEVLTGFYTVRKILSVLPATKLIGRFLYMPFVDYVGDPAYRFVSTRRYKWFGRVPYDGQ